MYRWERKVNKFNSRKTKKETTVLRSTAPAPLGVRKVHKIVYNIASIFNFGLALRALAAVLPSYYTRGRGVAVDLVVGYYPGVVLGVWG